MRDFQAYGYKIDLVDLRGLREVQGYFKELEKKYNEPLIRKRAEEDAGCGIPQTELALPSPFEKELKHAAADLASRVASTYKGPLELLDAKIKAERELLESKRTTELERIESLYEAEKQAAEDGFGLAEAHKELEKTERQYNSIYERYHRAPIAYIPHWVYIVFAVLIFLGEIPLNAMVFQIFAESQVMTWVMAFVVGLSVPISAHFIGIKFREHPDGFSLPNALKASVGLAVVGGALYWLSTIRQTYLGENKEALGLTDALVQSSFLFFWLNIAVLSAAIMISYLSHDPVPGYKETSVRLERSRKNVQKKEARRIQRLKVAADLRAKKKDQVHEEFREKLSRVNMMKGTYDQLLKEGQEHESRCLDQLLRLISIYRHENLRHREDRSVPKSFHDDAVLELELVKMKEKLNNEDNDVRPAA
ncbi:MAG: hypothetical protein U0136_19695 [Bdellovibrionota bacterium]